MPLNGQESFPSELSAQDVTHANNPWSHATWELQEVNFVNHQPTQIAYVVWTLTQMDVVSLL